MKNVIVTCPHGHTYVSGHGCSGCQRQRARLRMRAKRAAAAMEPKPDTTPTVVKLAPTAADLAQRDADLLERAKAMRDDPTAPRRHRIGQHQNGHHPKAGHIRLLTPWAALSAGEVSRAVIAAWKRANRAELLTRAMVAKEALETEASA